MRSARRPPASSTSSSSPGSTTRPSSHRAGQDQGMATRIDLNCDLGEELDAWVPGVDGAGQPAARRRDQRERRLRLPRGRRADHGRGLRGRRRSAGWPSVRTSPTWTGRTSVDGSSTCPPTSCGRRSVDQIETLQAIAAARGDAGGLREAARGALQRGRPPRGARAGGRRRRRRPAGRGPARVRGARRGGRAAGLRAVTEAFADRGYRADGTLVPRSEPGALVTDADEVAARVVRLARRGRRPRGRRDRRPGGGGVGVRALGHPGRGGAGRAAVRDGAAARHGVTVAPFTGPAES